MSTEEAQNVCTALSKAESEASTKLDAANFFVLDRQREQGDAAPGLAELATRLGKAKDGLREAKSTASEHEQKFVSIMLHKESSQHLKELQTAFEKAADFAKPLTEAGGVEFVAASKTKVAVDAFSELMQR